MAEALRLAERAWRSTAPRDEGAEAMLRHGARVWWLLREDAGSVPEGRALAAAALLHEIGRFVPDRGHYAIRGARWIAVHLDRILTAPTSVERRLVGELLLFQRHRGPLPPDVARPDWVDRFRAAERRDLERTPPDDRLLAAEAVAPRGPLAAALRRSDRRELWHHPRLASRVTRIRRPDR